MREGIKEALKTAGIVTGFLTMLGLVIFILFAPIVLAVEFHPLFLLLLIPSLFICVFIKEMTEIIKLTND